MTSIRRVRKTFYHKYGIKQVSFHVHGKSHYRIQINPTSRKALREKITNLMNKSKSLAEFICTLTRTAEE